MERDIFSGYTIGRLLLAERWGDQRYCLLIGHDESAFYCWTRPETTGDMRADLRFLVGRMVAVMLTPADDGTAPYVDAIHIAGLHPKRRTTTRQASQPRSRARKGVGA